MPTNPKVGGVVVYIQYKLVPQQFPQLAAMITDFSFDSGADGIDETRIVQAQQPEPSEYLSIKLSFCVLTSG